MYISNQLTKDLAQRELRKGKYIKHSELDTFLHDYTEPPIQWVQKVHFIKFPKTYIQDLAIKKQHERKVKEIAAWDKAHPFTPPKISEL